MTELPSPLTPEVSAWLQTQIAMSTARAMAPLREELSKLDDWANGLYLVLNDVLPFLLRTHPNLGREIAPRWQAAAERFDCIDVEGHVPEPDESLELLEARKMLYRMFALLKLWPEPEARRPAKPAAVRRRA